MIRTIVEDTQSQSVRERIEWGKNLNLLGKIYETKLVDLNKITEELEHRDRVLIDNLLRLSTNTEIVKKFLQETLKKKIILVDFYSGKEFSMEYRQGLIDGIDTGLLVASRQFEYVESDLRTSRLKRQNKKFNYKKVKNTFDLMYVDRILDYISIFQKVGRTTKLKFYAEEFNDLFGVCDSYTTISHYEMVFFKPCTTILGELFDNFRMYCTTKENTRKIDYIIIEFSGCLKEEKLSDVVRKYAKKRASKKELVLKWKQKNNHLTPFDCASELGISYNTARKWWEMS